MIPLYGIREHTAVKDSGQASSDVAGSAGVVREPSGWDVRAVGKGAALDLQVRTGAGFHASGGRGLLGCGLVLALAMVATWPALAQSGDARRWSRVRKRYLSN